MLLMIALLRGQALKLLILHLSLLFEGKTEVFEARRGKLFLERVGGKAAKYTSETVPRYHQDASQVW